MRFDAPTDTYIAVARYRGCGENRRCLSSSKCNAKFAPHPCREWACPFRLLRFSAYLQVGLAHKAYRCNFNAHLKSTSSAADGGTFPSRGRQGTQYRSAAQSRFSLHLRHRVHTKNVLAQRQFASEKATPQPASLTAPLTQGSQCGAAELSGALPPLCKGRWVVRFAHDSVGLHFQRRNTAPANTVIAGARY